jgi:membrane protease YdiL (CAAX protease family)
MLAGVGLIAGSFIIAAEHALLLAGQNGKSAGVQGEVFLTRMEQVTGTVFLFLIPSYIFTYITAGPPAMRNMGFSSSISRRQLLLVVIMFIASFFISSALEFINQNIPLTRGLESTFKHWEDEYDKQAATLGSIRSGGEYFIALFILALLPAIAEEMLFRGCLQNVLVNITRSAAAGIIITSILFSLMHGSYYGFLVRLFLGCMLGYIYYYSKNIWLNVALHFLNNAFAVTAMYLAGKSVAGETAKAVPAINFMLMGVAAFAGLLYTFKLFKQESEAVLYRNGAGEI